MKQAKLGSANVEVSSLCLGCMNFGTKENEEISFKILDRYVEAGGSFLDTANNYAFWQPGGKGGESETLLGKWMKERQNRADIFLATKVGFNTPKEGRSLSAKMIAQEIDRSLDRLGTDYVDLYYAHCDDRNTPLEETLEAFDNLVQSGKVRYIGCSNTLAWRAEKSRWLSRTNNWPEYCCVQQRFTYLRPKPGASFAPQVSANDDLLDYCANENITLLPYSPLLGGSYTRSDKSLPQQYLGPDAEARLEVLNAVAQETGATVNQVILAWMINSKPPMIPVIAASTLEQLNENLCALDVHLTSEQMERLRSATG